MNPFEMVVLIVAIVVLGSFLRARHSRRNEPPVHDTEKQQLREEVRMLKDRVAVLERIATDRESTLEQEIEKLRDR